MERDTAHLTIHTCRWLASNGCHSFSPTVCFIWNTMKRVAYPDAMPSTLRVFFFHTKRSRMTTFHVEPFTHMAGAICVYKLWLGHRRSLFDAFDRCPPEPLFYFCVISFAFCAYLVHFYQPGGVDPSNSDVCFTIEYRR